MNALADHAQAWPDAGARRRAADQIKAAFERFGWSAPRNKADKRKKQESKRQKQLEAIINGQA